MFLALRMGQRFAIFMGILGLSACASVKVSVPGFQKDETAQVIQSERVALIAAADALADQPWGEVDDDGMMNVLFGKLKDTPQDQALADYITFIHQKDIPAPQAVVADADQSLARARQVAEAGRQAVEAITPVSSDIITLEAAIKEARECRSIYVKALQKLASKGEDISKKEVRQVRDAFTQTIADIGKTADLVAERLEREATQTQLVEQNAIPLTE